MLTVTSGTDRIWSSADCLKGGAPLPVELAARKAVTYSVTWPGRRSSVGCPSTGAVALPGTYRVTVTVGAVSSPAFLFLIQPATPSPTASATAG